MDGTASQTKPWVVVVLSFGVLLLVAFGWPDARRGYTDFLSFYAGARLVGTPYLYSPAHANEIQNQYGRPEEVRAFIRPPFYALLLWPLGKLPYHQAHAVWQLLNIAALAGFILLWSPGAEAVVLCCWYFPLWICFVLGQDLPVFLLVASISAFLLRRQENFTAGLVFALCGLKFNLFFLVPLVALSRRLWGFLAGVATGGALMLAVSFGVAGWDWPVRYYSLLEMNERLQGSQSRMPNLKGLFFGVPYSTVWRLLAAAVVLGGAWYVIRRASLKQALAAAMAAGLLISPHAYLPDCSLLLPLLVNLAAGKRFGKALAAMILTGLATLALTKPPWTFVGQLAILSFFVWVVYLTYRRGWRGTEAADERD